MGNGQKNHAIITVRNSLEIQVRKYLYFPQNSNISIQNGEKLPETGNNNTEREIG